MNCAYCKESLNPSGDLACVRCRTVLHEECAEEGENCVTLGCGPLELVPYRRVGRRLRPELTSYVARRELRSVLSVLIAPREEISLLVLGLLGLAGLAILV